MITIPVIPDAPHQDLTTNLDGKDFVLSLRFNQREGVFYVGIGLVGQASIANAKLVCNWPLFRNVQAEDLPPGALVCVPSGGTDDPPGLGELGPGKRCELIYLSRAEIDAL